MAFTVTLGSVTLEAVNSIQFNNQGNIAQWTLPPTDGAGAGDVNAQIFDLLGAATIITLQGIFAPLTGKTVKSQFEEVSNLITGNQAQITLSTTDGLFADQSVMVGSLNTIWNAPANRATYELKLLKGLRGGVQASA